MSLGKKTIPVINHSLSYATPGHSMLQLSPSLGPYLPEVFEQIEVPFLFWKLVELVFKCLGICIHSFHSEKHKNSKLSLSHTVKSRNWEQSVAIANQDLHNAMTTGSTHNKQML